jgi:hypothetical protein
MFLFMVMIPPLPKSNVDVDSSLYPRTVQPDEEEEEEEEEEDLVDAEGDVIGGDSVPTPMDNVQSVMEKVSFYSNKLYLHARKEDEEKERGVRKYSRKLMRLMKRFQNNQQEKSL